MFNNKNYEISCSSSFGIKILGQLCLFCYAFIFSLFLIFPYYSWTSVVFLIIKISHSRHYYFLLSIPKFFCFFYPIPSDQRPKVFWSDHSCIRNNGITIQQDVETQPGKPTSSAYELNLLGSTSTFFQIQILNSLLMQLFMTDITLCGSRYQQRTVETSDCRSSR